MGTIRARGKKHRIEVAFMYRGIRRFEQSKYFCESGKTECKCRSCRSALALVAEIERKITEKTFKYADYFPESKTLQKLSLIDISENISFADFAQKWLTYNESTLAYSTYQTYTSSVKQLVHYFSNFELKSVKPSDIQKFINSSTNSPKTIANIMGVLHQIFEAACNDDIMTRNPVKHIKKPIVHTVQVDPFEHEEATQILNWMQSNNPQITIFFALGFYTGMRTGEILALQWNDMDFQKHTIRVHRTITKNRIKESTKTASERTIDIIPALDKYLSSHKQYSFMKSDWVLTTLYDQPFMKTENINRLYFMPCLKALGLRYRTLYQMRHSFACMMLDANENLNWIKNMLGHSTLEMIIKRYGNRITRQDSNRKGVIFSEKCGEYVANSKSPLKTIENKRR